jgi:peptidoglycan/LPS O-acetylase OafA/YrhL
VWRSPGAAPSFLAVLVPAADRGLPPLTVLALSLLAWAVVLTPVFAWNRHRTGRWTGQPAVKTAPDDDPEVTE